LGDKRGGKDGEGDKRDFINRVLHGDAEATRILIGLRGMDGEREGLGQRASRAAAPDKMLK